MIVFDLKCAQSHIFEGWFASSGAFEDQRERGLIQCPMCGDATVCKAVSAPNIHAKSNARPAFIATPLEDETVVDAPSASVAETSIIPAEVKAAFDIIAKHQAKLLETSQWVGRDFSNTVRAMHYGEANAAPVHGEVAPAEAKSLIDEGISIVPLLIPYVPPEQQN
jgi:hypothetical protein